MGNSHQKGWVVLRGKKWYGYYRKVVLDPTKNEEKTDVIPVVLGTKSEFTKFQARERLEQEIARQLGRQTNGRVMNDGAVTFGWFLRNRFLPLKEAVWKPETAKVKKLIIQKDLTDTFESIPLEDFDRFTLQVHMNKLATTRSKDRVLQVRAYLRDIFVEAVEQDFLSRDPARKVTVPTQLRETDRTTLSWEQLRQALLHLPLRDRLLLELDMTNALRPSELFALRWKCFNRAESKMQVFETTYKGEVRPWGKTKKSLGLIHLPKALAGALSQWKQQCPDDSPEAFIFPDADGGFMDTGNYRRRVLHKVAADLGLPKLTFQVIRRSIATLAQRKGTVKDVQGLLRHSRTATTTDVYMQELPEGVAATVDAINRELRKKTKKAVKAVRVAENLLPNATKSATTENGRLGN
jgi:integrase